MKTVKSTVTYRLARFFRCESGVTAMEYSIIAAMICLAALAAYKLSGGAIGSNL